MNIILASIIGAPIAVAFWGAVYLAFVWLSDDPEFERKLVASECKNGFHHNCHSH